MLNENQLAILKTDIAADPTLASYAAEGRQNDIMDAYNIDASPTFIVWKSDVRPDVVPAVFVWTEIGLNDAFSATTATKAAVLAAIKRPALRGERLFATGTGSDATPGNLVVVGKLTNSDIDKALRLP